MATVYDVIALGPGASWIADGSTTNDLGQDDLSLIEPVTLTDENGDGHTSAGDTFNGSEIVTLSKFAGNIVYDFGASSASRTGIWIETADGNVYLLFPDGTDYAGITKISAVAESRHLAAAGSYATTDDNVTIACFAPGTQIETPQGAVPVEALTEGSFVSTADGDPQPIRWMWRSEVSLDSPAGDPTPVLIKAGALDARHPKSDLVVSPQHRVLVGGRGQLEQHFDKEVLVPAKALGKMPGIRRMRGKRKITWHHFACPRHSIVLANGCWTESLLIGKMVMQGVSRSHRDELHALFPPTAHSALNGPIARPVLSVGEAARAIASRRAFA